MTSRLEKMVSNLAQHEPGFKISYKTDSKLMKFLDKILFFNPDFMTKYTTVLGKTIYFPSKESIKENTKGKLITVAHEYQHVKDSSDLSSFVFTLAYLSPQILAPFMLLFCFFYWWLGLLLFALFLTPLPAYGRMLIEKRGYVMTLFASNEIYLERKLDYKTRKELLLGKIKTINKQFTSSSYYFMWPFGIKKSLKKEIDRILNEEILKDRKSFLEVRRALRDSKY